MQTERWKAKARRLSQTTQNMLLGSYMPPFSNIKRVYTPEDLRVMTIAYDKACKRLPKEFHENKAAARKLSLIVLRAMERGVSDPENIADMAILEFFR
jgi:hypothetical protein